MKQRFIIADYDYHSSNLINKYLDDGWKIVSMAPQPVSVAITGESYNSKELKGKLAVLLQKD